MWMIITSNGPQNIGQIKMYFENGDLYLSPEEYQRENAWNTDQKKLLVDTIFRGMDIPKFYIWKVDLNTLANGYPEGDSKELYKSILHKKVTSEEDPNPYLFEVVDGQQRIRTILEYIGTKPPNKMVYRGTWHDSFPSLSDTPLAKGKSFANLNPGQKIKFEQTPLTVMVLENAKIDEIRDMFLRLQNGTPLNAQQKRDATGSSIIKEIRKLVTSHFFTESVYFTNDGSAYNLVLAQIINMEYKEKIISCTSRQLDKLYEQFKNISISDTIITKVNQIVKMLGEIFKKKCPHLNRSYALSLYWAISKIIENYDIPKSEYAKIRSNFEKLDTCRLEAMNRDYSKKPDDDMYFELSLAMSHGTDGADAISSRHDIVTQNIFMDITLELLPVLDPIRLFSHEEKLILFKYANGKCQLEHNNKKCGRNLTFDESVVDHILPHSSKGRTELPNGRIAYKLCNIARGNKDNFNPHKDCKYSENE